MLSPSLSFRGRVLMGDWRKKVKELRFIFWSCIGVIFFIFVELPSIAMTKATMPAIVGHTSSVTALTTHTDLVAHITHFSDSRPAEIHLASVSTADPLQSCPIDTMPPELQLAVDQIVSKARGAISNIRDSQGDRCAALEKRLLTSQAQIGDALKYQFIASNAIASNASQVQINSQTQQAAAVNQFILTASDLLQTSCISSIDDRVVIQKLIGQITTLTGLFMGGWQGIAIAAGGQFIGNVPIFKSEIDGALELFQHYDEKKERGSFLCLFRQMKKTSCLLFSKDTDEIVNGLDMSFKSGAPQTTQQSLESYRTENPALLSDIQLLREIATSSDSLMRSLEETGVLSQGSPKVFDQVLHWCQTTKTNALTQLELYPSVIPVALNQMTETCESLRSFLFHTYTQNDYVKVLNYFYSNLYAVSEFYQSLKKDPNSMLGKWVGTWESQKYFEGFRDSVAQYRQSSSGNQARINYLQLTESLSNAIAYSTFNTMMKKNYRIFMDTTKRFLGFEVRAPWLGPLRAYAVRQRALEAMIDLCQTFDPTLTCLYVGPPEHDSLFQEWRKRCVGPKSDLCRDTISRGEREFLLTDLKYRKYFDSLCGVAEF